MAPGGGFISFGGVRDLSAFSCLLLCIFQNRFLSATVNCPRHSSSLGETLRLLLCDLELRDFDRDFDSLGVLDLLLLNRELEWCREVDLPLPTDLSLDGLLLRDPCFGFRLICLLSSDLVDDRLDEDDLLPRDFGVQERLRLLLGVKDREHELELEDERVRA